jgi:hypothetical protein
MGKIEAPNYRQDWPGCGFRPALALDNDKVQALPGQQGKVHFHNC